MQVGTRAAFAQPPNHPPLRANATLLDRPTMAATTPSTAILLLVLLSIAITARAAQPDPRASLIDPLAAPECDSPCIDEEDCLSAEAGAEAATQKQPPTGNRLPATAKAAAADPKVLIGVTSKSSNAKQRAAIRRTWGADRRIWQLLFVVARPASDAALAKLRREASKHGDLTILYHVLEHYRNITYQSLEVVRAAHLAQRRITHVLKTDDDCYVRVPELLAFLRTLPSDEYTYIGASGRALVIVVVVGGVAAALDVGLAAGCVNLFEVIPSTQLKKPAPSHAPLTHQPTHLPTPPHPHPPGTPMRSGSRFHRQPHSKLYVGPEWSDTEHSPDGLPPYAYGAGWILSTQLAAELAHVPHAAMPDGLLNLEDVAVGLWVAHFARESRAAVHYVDEPRLNYRTECRDGDLVTHGVDARSMDYLGERGGRCP